MARRSKQRRYGGGKFKSERQRRAMWARAPAAAKRWAHNRTTRKGMWSGMRGAGRGRRSSGIRHP